MCLALAIFSALDSTAKWLGRDLPVTEVVFCRYFGAFALIALVLNPRSAPTAWRTPRIWLQVLRGLSLLGSTVGNFIALKSMPMADIMAINFSAPFLIALLAGPILGERIGFRQWGAIALGFLGVLVITHPGPGALNPAVLWTLAAVLCNAIYAITTRQLSAVASTGSMLVISAGLATLLLLPFLPAVWIWPSHPMQWLLMAQLGVFGAVGHFFMIRAYTLAPAPLVAPFTYTQMLWAALLGYVVFGDRPGIATAIGGGIVIASGLYLLYLETRSPGRATTTVPAAE